MGLDGGLLAGLFVLGISAFDPVGLAAMPILLSQPRGAVRAWTFLAGSTAALMVLGIAFASGLGGPIVRFSKAYPWLNPTVELVAALILAAIGFWLLRHARAAERAGGGAALTTDSFVKRLKLPLGLLFVFGFLLVAVQSLVDVVFLVAMVEMGTRELGLLATAISVAVYTFAALALQIAVVVGYQLLSADRRSAALSGFNDLLERRGEWTAGWLTLILGVVLAGVSARELLGVL